MAVELERGERERHRDPAPLLLGVEVADGRAVLDLAQAGDRPGGEQERLGERRLAGAAVAHEGDVADVGRRERLHPATPGFACVRSGDCTNAPSVHQWTARATAQARGPTRAGARWYPRSARGREHAWYSGRCARHRAVRPRGVLACSTDAGGTASSGASAPLGRGLRRIGVPADALTVFGLLASVATAVLIGVGPPRLGRRRRDRRRRRATCSTARSRAAAARRARAARSSTPSPIASPTRSLLGGVAWYLVGRARRTSRSSRFAVAACSMLVSYERATRRGARPRRPRRADGARRALRVPRRRARVQHPRAGAVDHARAHRAHRGATGSSRVYRQAAHPPRVHTRRERAAAPRDETLADPAPPGAAAHLVDDPARWKGTGRAAVTRRCAATLVPEPCPTYAGRSPRSRTAPAPTAAQLVPGVGRDPIARAIGRAAAPLHAGAAPHGRAAPAPRRRRDARGARRARGRRRVRLVRPLLARDASACRPRCGPATVDDALHDRRLRAHRGRARARARA